MTEPNWARVGEFLAQEVNLNDLFSTMGGKIAEQVQSERASIWLLDAAKGDLVNRVTDTPAMRSHRMSLGHGIVGHTAQTGLAIRVDDATSDPRWTPDTDDKTGYDTQSILSVPIAIDRHVLGVIQCVNARTGRFSHDDEERLLALAATLAQAIGQTSMHRQGLLRGVHLHGPYNNIIGESPELKRVYDILERAAPVDVPVLITGQTGTGKGLFARAIHFNSPRRDGPFVCVDCTNLPPTLIESTLFGHEKGAFTGASSRGIGKVEAANKGTLFIDEFGDLPMETQGKLLRLIQEREYERVGGHKTQKADIRLIFATHRNLAALVEARQFRADLYYRARVIEMQLPSLAERGGPEIERLTHHFLVMLGRRYGRENLQISPEALDLLKGHDWPGNIRELENALERVLVLNRSNIIQVEDFDFLYRSPNAVAQQNSSGPDMSMGQSLDEAIRCYVEVVLRHHQGNQSAAARALKISRNRLARILKNMSL